MKRKMIKMLALMLACVCVLSVSTFSIAAEVIDITYANGTARGYSTHEHFTPSNNERVFVKGNCVQNSASNGGAVYGYGQIVAATDNKQMYIYEETSSSYYEEYYEVSTAGITWNDELSFNHNYAVEIFIETTGYTGTDKVASIHNYSWDYNSAFGGMTIIMGIYTYHY